MPIFVRLPQRRPAVGRWTNLVPISFDANGLISARVPRPTVLSLAEKALSRGTTTTGLTVYALDASGVEVRSFAPAHGVDEDPVCGSGNAAVAAHERFGFPDHGRALTARAGPDETGRDH